MVILRVVKQSITPFKRLHPFEVVFLKPWKLCFVGIIHLTCIQALLVPFIPFPLTFSPFFINFLIISRVCVTLPPAFFISPSTVILIILAFFVSFLMQVALIILMKLVTYRCNACVLDFCNIYFLIASNGAGLNLHHLIFIGLS